MLDTKTIYETAMKQIDNIEPIPLTYSYSDTQFEILCKYIKEFESKLDSEHEVGLLLTNFGQSVTMHVKE